MLFDAAIIDLTHAFYPISLRYKKAQSLFPQVDGGVRSCINTSFHGLNVHLGLKYIGG